MTTIYDVNDGGDALTSGSAGLCDTGFLSNFGFNTGTHTWSWICEGNGMSGVNCSASESYCGDDAIDPSENCGEP